MFSKKQAGSPQPARQQVTKGSAAAAPSFSILGADMAITGDIASSSELHVDGKVEGDITCASLIQGESSEVIGAVKVQSARLAGVIRGTIDASELVILRTAHIYGDVHYDALTIEPGAQVEGRFAARSTLVLEPSLAMEGSGEPLLTLASTNA